MSQVESNMVPSIPLCTSGKDRSTTIDVPLRGFPLWFFTTMEDNLFSSELKDNFQQGLVLTVSAPSAFVATHVDTKIASTRGEEMFLGWYGNSTKLIKAMLKNASCPLVSVFLPLPTTLHVQLIFIVLPACIVNDLKFHWTGDSFLFVHEHL